MMMSLFTKSISNNIFFMNMSGRHHDLVLLLDTINLYIILFNCNVFSFKKKKFNNDNNMLLYYLTLV